MKLQTQDLDRGWLVWLQVDKRTIYVDDEAWPDIDKARDRADARYREKAVSWWTLEALIDLSAESKYDAPPLQPQSPEQASSSTVMRGNPE